MRILQFLCVLVSFLWASNSLSGQALPELSWSADGKQCLFESSGEMFVVDVETDIWGVIHWPMDFDAEKTYPVLENIYAGPHDHHVPKSFRKKYFHQHRLADAGMIVVQIDGMGTAWRSKKFHDACYKNLKDAGFPDRIA